MTIEEWAKDFKTYVNELDMPRDDYNGIMKYIDDALALMEEQKAKTKYCNNITLEYAKEVFRLQTLLKEQQEIVRCKDCTYRGEINCPQYYRRDELSDDYFCADGGRKEGR